MEEIKKKSWFQRNWKWAVPVSGCGCGCLALILIFVFGFGTAFFGLSKFFNESIPIQYATEKAFNNPKVIESLGDNLEKKGIPTGSVSFNDNDGKIDMSIPIQGSKGKGSIVIKGIKTDGVWAYEELYVLIKQTQQQINLLEKVTEGF